jgi:WD40 repeat protein
MVLGGHEGGVADGAFSPDDYWLVIGEEKGTARLWDLRARNPAAKSVALRGHLGQVKLFAFAPNGRWLVTAGSKDGNDVRVWDLRAADPAVRNVALRGYGWGINGLKISPDSRWLVTQHRDRAVRLWDFNRYHPGSGQFHDW